MKSPTAPAATSAPLDSAAAPLGATETRATAAPASSAADIAAAPAAGVLAAGGRHALPAGGATLTDALRAAGIADTLEGIGAGGFRTALSIALLRPIASSVDWLGAFGPTRRLGAPFRDLGFVLRLGLSGFLDPSAVDARSAGRLTALL
jgi:hypothetical protein